MVKAAAVVPHGSAQAMARAPELPLATDRQPPQTIPPPTVPPMPAIQARSSSTIFDRTNSAPGMALTISPILGNWGFGIEIGGNEI